MTALITRVGEEVDGGDMFAGWGGSSQGIHAAGATIRWAANHDPLSIECHNTNWGDVDHYLADLSDIYSPRFIDPVTLPPVRFLWASPSCKYHSKANAEKLYAAGPQAQLSFTDDVDPDLDIRYANSERSRVTMCCPLRYASRHFPEVAVIENVIEAAQWGPRRKGNKGPGDGSTFQWWLREWADLGYEHEVLFLNSMFFPPCPQSRDRMYVVFWRKGRVRKPDLDFRPTAYCTSQRCGGELVQAVQTWKPRTSCWPLARWGGYGTQYTYNCPTCRERVHPAAWPAYTAIDWSNLGPMLGERALHGLNPLRPNTVERIRRGLTKFRDGPPIILPAKGPAWGTDRPVTMPLPTQTSQQDKAIAFMVKNNGGADETGYRAVPIHDPLGSITTSPTQALTTAILNGQSNHSAKHAADPLFTVPAGGGANCLATEGVVLPAYGHVHERAGQTRARSLHDQLFTQHTSESFGFAHSPFVVEMRGGGSVRSGQHPVTSPLHAVTAGGMHHGLSTPGMHVKLNGGPGDTAWHGVDDPLNTIVTRGQGGVGFLVMPWVEQYQSDPIGVTEQLATCMTRMRLALASIEPGDLTGVTDEELESVRFRMLDPDPELRRAMAFGADYVLIGNKSEMTCGLGNAVTPPVATAITERCLAVLRDPGRLAA